MDTLIVIGMQNDLISGALATPQAQAIVDAAAEYIKNFKGRIIFTRDTHDRDYLSTQEGIRFPVKHCIKNTKGWKFDPRIEPLAKGMRVFDKPTFGSIELGQYLELKNMRFPIDNVTLIGIYTDVCVSANALLIKTFLPEANVSVVSSLCAGRTQEGHEAALRVLKQCQVDILP